LIQVQYSRDNEEAGVGKGRDERESEDRYKHILNGSHDTGPEERNTK
jgi:hypothetical protein